LLFAGRIETDKGVFDLLSVVARIQSQVPDGLVVEMCGSGSAEQALVAAISERGLAESVHFLGRLNRQEMREAYSRAHAVLVPTLSSFAEGLNRVVMESVLSGRPVVATEVCNTQDVFEHSAIHVRTSDIEAMADAILRLATDCEFYEAKRAGCKLDETPFYDTTQSWGAALSKAIGLGLECSRRGTS
jgi:glycosyltransferase involved in cell wall biosynthesis